MKIIDLLNKIANGEEVPKKIILFNVEWEYIGYQYRRVDEENQSNIWNGYNFNLLNQQVEIIEEDNKIEKIERLEYSTNFNKEEFMLYQNILAVNGNVNDLIDRVYELEKRYEKQDK